MLINDSSYVILRRYRLQPHYASNKFRSNGIMDVLFVATKIYRFPTIRYPTTLSNHTM